MIRNLRVGVVVLFVVAVALQAVLALRRIVGWSPGPHDGDFNPVAVRSASPVPKPVLPGVRHDHL